MPPWLVTVPPSLCGKEPLFCAARAPPLACDQEESKSVAAAVTIKASAFGERMKEPAPSFSVILIFLFFETSGPFLTMMHLAHDCN